MKKQNNTRPSVSSVMVWMRLAVVLLCLVVLSANLMSGLLAKYRTSDGASESAKVAGFAVNVTGKAGNTAISAVNSQKDGEYQVTVDNSKSDVAINYDIIIQFIAPAAGISVKIGDKVGTVSADQKTVIFEDVGILVAHAKTSHDLRFIVSDWGAFTENQSGSSVSVNLNFTVTVDVRQVD